VADPLMLWLDNRAANAVILLLLLIVKVFKALGFANKRLNVFSGAADFHLSHFP